MSTHAPAEVHDHQHGNDCGHLSRVHDDHVDYLHDGHAHFAHEDHYDECSRCACANCDDDCTACVCIDCTCAACDHQVAS